MANELSRTELFVMSKEEADAVTKDLVSALSHLKTLREIGGYEENIEKAIALIGGDTFKDIPGATDVMKTFVDMLKTLAEMEDIMLPGDERCD